MHRGNTDIFHTSLFLYVQSLQIHLSLDRLVSTFIFQGYFLLTASESPHSPKINRFWCKNMFWNIFALLLNNIEGLCFAWIILSTGSGAQWTKNVLIRHIWNWNVLHYIFTWYGNVLKIVLRGKDERSSCPILPMQNTTNEWPATECQQENSVSRSCCCREGS